MPLFYLQNVLHDSVQFFCLPYILAYKLQNLRPNLDEKVGRATYTRVIKKKFLQLVEPVSLKHARTPTRRESSIKADVVLSGPLSQRPPPGRRMDAGTLHLEVYSGQLTKLIKL